MPGMTGSQLAAAIREKWPNLPVILATGYAELPPGAATDLPRLNKPFSQKALADAVTAAMHGV
jgi:FixJ family two-component response regulator